MDIGTRPLTHPHLSPTLFFSVCWGSVAICTCMVAFRLGVRLKLFRQLFWDDGLVVFALVCFFAQAITWSIRSRGMFLSYELTTGRESLTPENVVALLESFKVLLASVVLFMTSLWAIKLAFLIFFKRIANRIQGSRIWWWWFVAVVVVLTYIPAVGTVPYKCMSGDAAYIAAHCADDHAKSLFFGMFYYQMGADILTDLLLVSIPVVFFWTVRMPLKQKLGLIGLFSLTLMVIAVAVIRITSNGGIDLRQDTIWLAFWALIEYTIAIIVACLGSFRQLFVKGGNTEHSAAGPSRGTMLTSVRARVHDVLTAPSRWQQGHRKSPSGRALILHEEAAHSSDLEEKMLAQKGTHVEYEVEIARVPVPLKRASQAHIAHHSVAPTERRYLVVHPGDSSSDCDLPLERPGYI